MPGNLGGPSGPADPARVVGPDGLKGAKVGRGGPGFGPPAAKGAWGCGSAGVGTGGRLLASGCRCGGYHRPSDANHHPGGAPTSDIAGYRPLAHGCAHTGLSAGQRIRLSTRHGTSRRVSVRWSSPETSKGSRERRYAICLDSPSPPPGRSTWRICRRRLSRSLPLCSSAGEVPERWVRRRAPLPQKLRLLRREFGLGEGPGVLEGGELGQLSNTVGSFGCHRGGLRCRGRSCGFRWRRCAGRLSSARSCTHRGGRSRYHGGSYGHPGDGSSSHHDGSPGLEQVRMRVADRPWRRQAAHQECGHLRGERPRSVGLPGQMARPRRLPRSTGRQTSWAPGWPRRVRCPPG
jgi:hypothetical protein